MREMPLFQQLQIFSREQPVCQIHKRGLSDQSLSKSSNLSFRTDSESFANMANVQSYRAGLSRMPLHIRDLSIQLPGLLVTAREWHRRHGITLLAVDYLQLVRDSRNIKAYDRVSEVDTSLKSLAQDMGMMVVGLSQLSRECEKRLGWDKRPVLGNFLESGNLEQYANNVLMLFSPYRNGLNYNDKSATQATLEIHVSKLQNGKPTQTGINPSNDGALIVYDSPINRFFDNVPSSRDSF